MPMPNFRKFNPFGHIASRFELAPHEHTLNSTFGKKLKDAYLAIYGSPDLEDGTFQNPVLKIYFGPKSYFGILDYATLFIDPLLSLAQKGITTGLNKIEGYTGLKYALAAAPLYLARFILGVPQVAVRVAATFVAGALTLGTMFVTGAVAAISAGVKKSLEKRAGTLTFIENLQNVKFSDVDMDNSAEVKLDKIELPMSTGQLFRVVINKGDSQIMSKLAFSYNDIKKPKNQDEKAFAAMVKLNSHDMASKVGHFAPARQEEQVKPRGCFSCRRQVLVSF